MKAHVLLNVLNHVPADAEVEVGEVITLPDGRRFSLSKSAETMTPGQSHLVRLEEDARAPG